MPRIPMALLILAHLTFGAGAAGAQVALQPVLYDDCGSPGRQPHTAASAWTFPEAAVSGSEAARTVAFDARAVVLRYAGLASDAQYALRFTYATETDGPRTQRVLVNGTELQPATDLPRGEARTYDLALPDDVANTGTIELAFERVSGPNAVVSEVWLLSDAVQPSMALSTASDLRGELTARCWSGLLEPLAGARIVLAAGERQVAWATTGPDGAARFALSSLLADTHAGALTITAEHGAARATTEAPIEGLVFRRPILTPVPEPADDSTSIPLSGEWAFCPAPEGEWWRVRPPAGEWKPIQVPGEWAMQGFRVAPGTAAGYRTVLALPAEWRGSRAKIRFDAVYSVARVWLNGRLVGQHEGGFTPFEVDVTDAARFGAANVLCVAVTNESLADTLASGSSYARHQLGGIARKVTAFRVPETHLTRLQVVPELAQGNGRATLRVLASAAGPEPAVVRVRLEDPSGREALVGADRVEVPAAGDAELAIAVRAPVLWDAEHPNLYTLRAEVSVAGRPVERLSRRVGVRRVEVIGNRLVVNGRPVHLHGTCRHEQERSRGRSLRPEDWARDIEMLKGANVNYVRTSHYPPAEEFIALCDEAGIYVQEEGPWCWVSPENAGAAGALPTLLRGNAEMLERDLSHPSVILWDLANESAWGANFDRVLEWTRQEDPARPTVFSSGAASETPCDIVSWHYPGLGGADRVAQATRPWTFDEYMHLNCYNAAEVSLDPGLRDYWGRPLRAMWEAMRASDGCLGGAIWCWSDDVFDVPGEGTIGYGEWGVIDGAKRAKPEWWHVRRAYSPVRLPVEHIAPDDAGAPVRVPVENRFDFTNLSEVACWWRVGEQSGRIAVAAAPGETGTLVVPVGLAPGEALELRFETRAGTVLDSYELPYGETDTARPTPGGGSPRVVRADGGWIIWGDDGFAVRVNREIGWLTASGPHGAVIYGGPMVVAAQRGSDQDAFMDIGSPAASNVTVAEAGDHVRVEVAREASFGPVRYVLSIYGDGTILTEYALTYEGADIDAREVGLAWDLPATLTDLEWLRKPRWGAGDEDHLGRFRGGTSAFPVPEGETAEAWGYDYDARGCADFRSTKYDLIEATLRGAEGAALRVFGGGAQHLRATVRGDHVQLRVNDFANGGGESFLQPQLAGENRVIRAGEVLTGTCQVRVL
jgi:beta-galactosidase